MPTWISYIEPAYGAGPNLILSIQGDFWPSPDIFFLRRHGRRRWEFQVGSTNERYFPATSDLTALAKEGEQWLERDLKQRLAKLNELNRHTNFLVPPGWTWMDVDKNNVNKLSKNWEFRLSKVTYYVADGMHSLLRAYLNGSTLLDTRSRNKKFVFGRVKNELKKYILIRSSQIRMALKKLAQPTVVNGPEEIPLFTPS